MKTLKIFLASSCELTEHRTLVGDYIRRLSYDYSPRGVRLRLVCWEDFYPEYSGTSKQQEYDEQLIKTCDIFIAMFRTRCGMYTQHEVALAIELNKECHILQLPSIEENKELDDFLSSIRVSAVRCDESELLAFIGDIIDKYLQTHNISLSPKAVPLNTWRLYATIPDDFCELRIPFSNLVRGIEGLLEETLGCYFTLYPYRTPEHIGSTDYFLCVIKDRWNQEDEREIEMAYASCKATRIPETALLYQKKGHLGEENNSLAVKIATIDQGFSKTFSHIDTIKSDLMAWALRHKMSVALDAVKAFSLDGDIVYCYDRPFFYLPMFPELYEAVKSITTSIAKIDVRIKRNIKNGKVVDETIALDLSEKRHNKEQQLHSTIINWYNNTQLLECSHLYEKESVVDTVRTKQITQYQTLSDRIKLKIGQTNKTDVQFLTDLAANLLEWESVAYTCLSLDAIPVSEYIQVLAYIVNVCDTYLAPSSVIFDEDEIFKKIIDTADKYDYHTLFTETMRVNYANSFSKDLDLGTAGRYYRDAYEHILKIEDDSVLAHHYKSYVIHFLLLYYVNIDDKQEILKLGNQYIDIIHHWQEINTYTNYDVDLARCYAAVLAAAPKYKGVCADLAAKAETLIVKLHKTYDSRPFDEDYFDAICYFNIVLSAYFTDRYELGDEEYFAKALYYIKESRKSLLARYPYDPQYIQRSLSQPFHNRGFLYSKANRWKEAISNYKSALSERRKLYKMQLTDELLFEVAQTLVNLGDAYLHIKRFDKALEYVDEAISIYRTKRAEGLSVFDMYYYEAYQLKATILMDIDKENGKYPSEALKMMQECMAWSDSHSENDYVDRFDGVSGVILNYYKNIDK